VKNKIIDKLKPLINWLKSIRRNSKIFVYLIFVGIATVLWFLNKLNNTYSAEIVYPVEYSNEPKDQKILNILQPNIILKITAPGYTLLRYQMQTTSKPIDFDLKKGNITKKSANTHYILTREYKTKVAEQLPSDVKLESIEPDTLFFRFTKIISVKKKVTPVYNLTFEQQHRLKEKPFCSPDSVIVTGPKIILDTLETVYTQPISIKKVNKTTKRNVSIKEINEITTKPKRVVVNIKVEQYTEAEITVPVKIINVPDSINLISFTDSVNVKGIVGLSSYDLLTADDFQVVLDYNNINPSISREGKISLIKHPSFFNFTNLNPEKVEFLIEKQ